MARILILEDNTDLAELYKMMLEGDNHQVIGTFDDPRQALQDPAEADLILLDERLAGLSGTAYLPELRQAFPGARILVATADPEAAEAAVTLGADKAKRKPFTLAQLREEVNGLLEGRNLEG